MKARIKNLLLLSALIAALGMMLSGEVKAQTFTTLYSFTASVNGGGGFTNSDGYTPVALILSSNTLYGTAFGGGVNANGTVAGGTVFAVNTNGTGFAVLYTFTNGIEGDGPNGLILSGNTLYGTTWQGGTNDNSYGTIFAINTDGTKFTSLYSFNDGGSGSYPNGNLILSGNTLYGSTRGVNSTAYGTVFEANTNGTNFTSLPSLLNFYETFPVGALVLAGNNLYGMQEYGGSSGNGAVFSINTNGLSYTNLYNFTAIGYSSPGHATNSDGAYPCAGLILSGSTLYGATASGGTNANGTLFAVDTNGSNFRILHTFSPIVSGTNNDGATPNYLILSSNTIYGTAGGGGISVNGTVFSINTNGANFTVLHSFSHLSAPSYAGGTNSDGTGPNSLILFGNTLYGTAGGGGTNDNGTIFSISLVSVSASVQITTTSLPNGTNYIIYSQALSASGGQPPYYWTNISGALPSELFLSTNGVISGTPTTNGTFNFTVKVTDATNSTATQVISLTIGLLTLGDSDFSQPALGSGVFLQSDLATSSSQPWTFAGYSGIANDLGSPCSSYAVSNPSYAGQYAYIQLAGGNNGSTSQTVTFPSAGTYSLSFLAAGRVSCSGSGGNLNYIIKVAPSAGGSSALSVTNATTSGQAFTNVTYQFTIPAPGNYIISFTSLSGFEPYSDNTAIIDNVSLTNIASAPAFQPAIFNNGKFMLTWSTVSNGVYQLQYKTNLLQTNWLNVGSAITASNTVLTVTNSINTDNQRFYRVQEQ